MITLNNIETLTVRVGSWWTYQVFNDSKEKCTETF